MWSSFKRWFARGAYPNKGETIPSSPRPPNGFQAPRPDLAGKEPSWIGADDNAFGVAVLDVRPITLGMLSTTRDPTIASNALSYGGEDGGSFTAQGPALERRVDADLRFRAPEQLVDGALFVPRAMEDKWAIFVQEGALLLVRSWRRELLLRAELRVEGAELHVGRMTGFVSSGEESEEYTRRAVEFILRTHGLEEAWPAPLHGTREDPPRALGLQCMSLFGRHAHFASFDLPARRVPSRRLRVVSRLHLAVMSDDLERAQRAMADGVGVGLYDPHGFMPIHYVREAGSMLDYLLANGADIDGVTDEGATALMLATQDRALTRVSALLELGASADAVDVRGFSALHRAAEMGEVPIVKALLDRGADPDRTAAGGESPRGLAILRGESSVLEVLPPPKSSGTYR